MAQIAAGWTHPKRSRPAVSSISRMILDATKSPTTAHQRCESQQRERRACRFRHCRAVPCQGELLAPAIHVESADAQCVLRLLVNGPVQVLDVVHVARRLRHERAVAENLQVEIAQDRKSTRLNSSHGY